MGNIFINYRRGDDPGFTQALYQRLESEFPAENLFMDVEGHIRPGDDFVSVLEHQVAQCDVLLAVIGPRWGDLLTARANEPDDFVAIEIKAAIDSDKRVIPVLVGGAAMPRAETLPDSIRSLSRRNAVGLRPERFKADCQGLVTALKEQLALAEKERAARTAAEVEAADAARRKEQAAAAAKAADVEQRARAQSLAGLSPEEIRKAEELASWQFVEPRGDVADLRDHLARYPAGVTARFASAKLEDLVWQGLGVSPTLAALRAFVDEFPRGARAPAAEARIAELEHEAAEARAEAARRQQETEAWATASAADTKEAYRQFLTAWPQSDHTRAARSRMSKLTLGPLRARLLKGAAITAVLVGVVGGAMFLISGGWRNFAATGTHQSSGASIWTRSDVDAASGGASAGSASSPTTAAACRSRSGVARDDCIRMLPVMIGAEANEPNAEQRPDPVPSRSKTAPNRPAPPVRAARECGNLKGTVRDDCLRRAPAVVYPN